MAALGPHQRFRRIGLLNRGEAAVRFLRAARDTVAEGAAELTVVAFFTDPDADAPFVAMADEAVAMGPAIVPGPDGPRSAYLDHDRMLGLLRAARCEAVWPGWGFVSEDPAFAALLEAEGIVFLGPSSDAMRRLGDKVAAKRLAAEVDVPVAAWRLLDDAEALDATARAELALAIGFPLMIKASAGGGGRGIRRVDDPSAFEAALVAARDEARKAFGEGTLFVERLVPFARHIEVQIVASQAGVYALGLRDCSVQRRHQKVLEEAPSPVVSPEAAAAMQSAAIRLATHAGYMSVGTVEFLYLPDEDRFFFLEMNSRLQVEHTVTEAVTGFDLVRAQIDIALGLPVVPPLAPPHGHAIEVRVNAEDPAAGFRPAPGIVRLYLPPTGPGIRVDSGIREGMVLSGAFDSMLAKVIAHGATRQQALARLTRALREMAVVVEDGATNKGFLLDLLSKGPVKDGSADVAWLDRLAAAGELAPSGRLVEAALAAALIDHAIEESAERQRFYREVQDGIPIRLPPPIGLDVSLRIAGRAVTLRVHSAGPRRFFATLGAEVAALELIPVSPHAATLSVDGVRHDILFCHGRAGIFVEVDGRAHHVEQLSGGVVKAPAPAMIVHVAVAEGDRVEAGARLATLEAMKMEMPLRAPEAGIVRSVLCQPNQQVVAGQPVLILEPSAHAGAVAGAPTLTLPTRMGPLSALFDGDAPHVSRLGILPPAAADAAIAKLCEIAHAVLSGYEVPPVMLQRIERLLGDDIDVTAVPSPERLVPLVETLQAFVDVESLFDRNLLPISEDAAVSAEIAFYDFCRRHSEGEAAASAELRPLLMAALRWHGISSLDPTDELRQALWRLSIAHRHGDDRHRVCARLVRLVMALHDARIAFGADTDRLLDRVAQLASPAHPHVADTARRAQHMLFHLPRFERRRDAVERLTSIVLRGLASLPRDAPEFEPRMAGLASTPLPILRCVMLAAAPKHRSDAPTPVQVLAAEATLRRLYEDADFTRLEVATEPVGLMVHARVRPAVTPAHAPHHVLAIFVTAADLGLALQALAERARVQGGHGLHGEIVLVDVGEVPGLAAVRSALPWSEDVARFARITVSRPAAGTRVGHRTFATEGQALVEWALLADIHPEAARRVELWRLEAFLLKRLPSHERIYAFRAQARDNAADERILVLAEVRDVPDAAAEPGETDHEHLLEFEHAFFEGLRVLRTEQARRAAGQRYLWNRMTFFFRSLRAFSARDIGQIARRLEPATRGLGLDRISLRTRAPEPAAATGSRDVEYVLTNSARSRLEIGSREPETGPVAALTQYDMRSIRARRLGFVYPYDLISALTGDEEPLGALHPDLRGGAFEEHDLEHAHSMALASVAGRPYGQNRSAVVVGIISHRTRKHPLGMRRVLIASDPTHAMGALAEPECRRILGALDLAESLGLPVEWIPISAGARIAMDSGTENLDWTARVLARLVRFTRAGGEVNVIVAGVNVGAQSYWNAEATMLMHTRGVLVMTPQGSMVLTGKKALEYSGSVSAEDERGIGGYERVMGPNGQAQYHADDLPGAYVILFEHYRFAYVAPGERGPRPDPGWRHHDRRDRSVLDAAYVGAADEPYATVGDVLDAQRNPERKKPFSIRAIMTAVVDLYDPPLERFRTMWGGETSVVWDAHIGGHSVTLLGIESRPLRRRGRIPLDGPDTWSGGTLFPISSKKVARALSAASGVRPVVVVANLSGFDGSPESLRNLQLEYGAEIGRAVVEFEGRIVFVVVGRYHGGAYVVFSKALNPGLRALAVEGTFASVIGGGPAAAVVFPREVQRRVNDDPRIIDATRAIQDAPSGDQARLREALTELRLQVTLEHQGELAREFDAIHSVERAVRVGSLDAVIPAAALRPAIIDALESD
jgi:acetyl/propionyl-CoA carboxylase alpha subunit/acetyl-CoA carboxylase carboxyltransferase component